MANLDFWSTVQWWKRTWSRQWNSCSAGFFPRPLSLPYALRTFSERWNNSPLNACARWTVMRTLSQGFRTSNAASSFEMSATNARSFRSQSRWSHADSLSYLWVPNQHYTNVAMLGKKVMRDEWDQGFSHIWPGLGPIFSFQSLWRYYPEPH